MSKFRCESKWTFKKSTKPMYKAVDAPMEVTIEEAIRRWGTNKWTWPVEPYTIIGFMNYKTPADVKREEMKRMK